MKMLKEERSLRHWALSAWMGPENKKQFRKDVSAFRCAVIDDICVQVADAVKLFPKKTQVKLLDAIMRYEKPKAIHRDIGE